MGRKFQQIHRAIVSALNFLRKIRTKKQSAEEEQPLVYHTWETISIEEENNFTAAEEADFELIQL